MKSTQLLSIVFSLIMFTGVTAGSVAFAESDDDSYGRHADLDDRLEHFCDMTDTERLQFFEDHPRLAEFEDRLTNFCDLSEDERETAIDEFIDEHAPDARDHDDYDLSDMVDKFCEMSADEQRQFYVDHPRLEQFSERIANYCDLSEDERDDAVDAFVKEHKDEFRAAHDGDMKDKLARYCEMSDADKRAFIAEHDKAEDHVEKMNEYCSLDEDARMDFMKEHRDEYKANMKDKMHDKMTDKKHMDYEKLCEMSSTDRAAEIDDSEKLDRISDWCEMSTDEREDYKKEHHDAMKDTMKDKVHDFDGMSDMAKDRMSDVAKDKLSENKMKMSDKSDRLKAMIMDKHDISDERRDEIKAKYIEKHGDLTDAKKSDLKMKYKDHMKTVKVNMSDERKSSIHDRVAEMKAFKAEFREKSSDMTDEEKQELRSEFIEQAKDMQLAWINPRIQMTAGIDSAEVECREGFSLVMKASNGVAMCLKADSALKMIDRGIVVPAN
jgi:hypothetical protein